MTTNKSNTNKLITNKKRLLTKTTTNKVSGANSKMSGIIYIAWKQNLSLWQRLKASFFDFFLAFFGSLEK
jgi:hypothetical protein